MYGSNPPPLPAPVVDLDDLFGIRPANPPPPQFIPSNGSNPDGGTVEADLPPPPPYWEETNGAHKNLYEAPPPPQQTYLPQQPHQGHSTAMAGGLPPSSTGIEGYPAPQPQGYLPYASSNSSPAPVASHYAAQQPYNGGGPHLRPQPQLQPQLQPQPQPQPQRSQEEEDKEQLEKIIRLRKELEAEQQREHDRRRELNTWGCPECTYRNSLSTAACEMCGTHRPGYAPAPTNGSTGAPSSAGASHPVPPPASSSSSQPRPQQVAAATAWQCGLCLAPNEASDARCRVCSGFRQSGASVPQGPVGGNSNGVQSRTPFTTNWKCSMCGKVNPPSKANCADCNGYQHNGTPVSGGVLKHTEPSSASTSTEAHPTTWQCSVCTLENKLQDAVCVACQSGQRPRHLAQAAPKSVAFSKDTKSPAPGGGPNEQRKRKWPCPRCTFHNSLRRSKCDMCAAPRPESYAPASSTATASDRESAKRAKKREEDSDEDEVQWQDDDVAKACNRCHQEFGFLRRRHHCRACGYVFCAVCSPFYLVLKKDTEPKRVCCNCYEARQGQDKQ